MTDLEKAQQVYQDRLAISARYEALKQEARAQSGLPLETVIVHTVIDTMGIEPDRRFYSGRLADGTRVEVPAEYHTFEGVRRTDKFWDNPKTGERCFFMRYEHACSVLPDEYVPTKPEILVERRRVRKAKQQAQAQAAYRQKFPLLVLAGGDQ